MLRISKLADYGTIIMVYLANQDPRYCNARDIALNTHLNTPTVSKLLKLLTTGGLLTSIRGVNGGYGLKRSTDEISIADIIYALETQRGLTECSNNTTLCSLQSNCNMQSNWQIISKLLEDALASVSLSAFAKLNLPTKTINNLNNAINFNINNLSNLSKLRIKSG